MATRSITILLFLFGVISLNAQIFENPGYTQVAWSEDESEIYLWVKKGTEFKGFDLADQRKLFSNHWRNIGHLFPVPGEPGKLVMMTADNTFRVYDLEHNVLKDQVGDVGYSWLGWDETNRKFLILRDSYASSKSPCKVHSWVLSGDKMQEVNSFEVGHKSKFETGFQFFHNPSGKIYYFFHDNAKSYVYRMNPDGSGLENLVTLKDSYYLDIEFSLTNSHLLSPNGRYFFHSRYGMLIDLEEGTLLWENKDLANEAVKVWDDRVQIVNSTCTFFDNQTGKVVEKKDYVKDLGLPWWGGVSFSPSAEKVTITKNGEVFILKGDMSEVIWEIKEDSAFYANMEAKAEKAAMASTKKKTEKQIVNTQPVAPTYELKSYCYVASFKKRTNTDKRYLVLINVRDFKGTSYEAVMGKARGRAKSIAWDNWEAIPMDEQMKAGVDCYDIKSEASSYNGSKIDELTIK